MLGSGSAANEPVGGMKECRPPWRRAITRLPAGLREIIIFT